MKLFKSEKLTPGSRNERIFLAAVAVCWVVLFVIDQLSKWYVAGNFYYGESIPVIKNFFSLTYVTNKGAAWSILSGHGNLLLLIGIAVFILSLIFFRKLTENFKERISAIMLILAGVAGNSFDRMWRGEVVDFFDFRFWSYHYPVFNPADCFICIGVILFLLSSLFRPEEKDAEAGNDVSKSAKQDKAE